MTTPPTDRAALLEAMAPATYQIWREREKISDVAPDWPSLCSREQNDWRNHVKDVFRAIEAAGCVVTPREATEEMLKARHAVGIIGRQSISDFYRAMAAASPYAPERQA
jgi:hypothetical protein